MASSAETTAANAWVSSYLDALLSYGLSSEYAQAPKEAGSAKAPDADRALYSRYYLKVRGGGEREGGGQRKRGREKVGGAQAFLESGRGVSAVRRSDLQCPPLPTCRRAS